MAGEGGEDESAWEKGMSLMPRMPKNMLSSMSESCLFHSVAAGAGGVALGIGMGVFVATFSAGHGEIIGSSMSQQLRHGFLDFWKQAIRRGYQSGKTFGAIGVVYAGLNCQVSRYRGTHDYYNSGISGGITGGLMGLHSNRRMGAKAISHGVLRGVAGFAAICVAMDWAMDNFLSDLMDGH